MNIVVYYKEGCPWAADVMDYFKERNIPFEGREITTNPEFAREVIAKTGQSKSPTVEIDGTILPDTDVDQVSKHLAAVGAA